MMILLSQPNRAGELDPELELGAREMGFFKGARALFSNVSGAGAGAIKIWYLWVICHHFFLI